MRIRHKFKDYKIQDDTEFLIIGTFNPDTPKNEADFFYGRPRNYLWLLLPLSFNFSDLRGKFKSEKLEFIQEYRIDFVDLISEVQVVKGQESNYYDICIDSLVVKWNNIIQLISQHDKIKKVCFTRKTLNGIPNMRTKIREIERYCVDNQITFKMLTTPARFYSNLKQQEWDSFFSDK